MRVMAQSASRSHIGRLDHILGKYHGREEELWTRLEAACGGGVCSDAEGCRIWVGGAYAEGSMPCDVCGVLLLLQSLTAPYAHTYCSWCFSP